MCSHHAAPQGAAFFLYESYFKRFGFGPPRILEPPARALTTVIVIPAFREPHLLAAFNSLCNCTRPQTPVEILIVVNSSDAASPLDLAVNLETIQATTAWSRTHSHGDLRTHIIHAPNLPRKHAGVGLARKIGMDEALHRFHQAQQPNGIIACFDADCVCDSNYLIELERYFIENPRSPGCSIYFEHPLEGSNDPRIYEAITQYELHLRYYVEALRFAGFPHAFHTVGSSMAVRAQAYMEQGGMNKRKAGEDFYFLHKIIPLGHFGELNTTRVIPSPRVSDRVPFGTGKAVGQMLAGSPFLTYPFEAFLDLRTLFSQIPALQTSDAINVPEPLESFLLDQNFPTALAELRSNTATLASFTNRFFRWFDAFLAMKYIHFARDTKYGATSVVLASSTLLSRLTQESAPPDARVLLLQYREFQRRCAIGHAL